MYDQEYLHSTYLSEEFIFVFGSNLQGIHGAGAAKYAYTFRGATISVGEGISGNSYAIPTKKSPNKRLSLSEIKTYVNNFIEYAKINKNKLFQVKKIGTGLAGYTDSEIAPMFDTAPKNCYLPGVWLRLKNPNMYRIIIAGSRSITDSNFVFNEIDKIISRLPKDADIEIISGLAEGVDTIAVEYCVEKDLKCIGFPAEWEVYKKRAGYIRNDFMAWYATHAIIFWDGDSRGTKSMIDISSQSLTYKVILYNK